MMIKLALCLFLAVALSAGAVAQSAPDQKVTRNFNRDVMAKMGIDQHEGAYVPKDVPFTDEHGRQIKFGDLLGSRPIVIMPMFFECQGVCAVETDSLLQTLCQISDKSIGRDFDVVLLSINPAETPAQSFPRWKVAVKTYDTYGNRPEAGDGFHFLTGSYANIRRVTDALGFRYAYDAKEGTINHPAGLMTLSPNGQITGYLINKEFPRTFLNKMIDDARVDRLSAKNEPMLFGCIMIDKETGKRSLVIENVIRLCAAIFAVGVATWIVSMSLSTKGRNKGGLA